MRIERREFFGNEKDLWGVVDGERWCPVAFPGLMPLEEPCRRSGEGRLRAPAVPSKIVCVGRNYRDHIREKLGLANDQQFQQLAQRLGLLR